MTAWIRVGIAGLWLCSTSALAQDVSDVSLDELLNAELAVASRKLLTPRESPGIVSVVMREELIASGARDLIDVLHQIPGFSFGMDVTGVVGAGFRGIWGHEGKVLLLVDGLEMNEPLYSSLQFGHELPVDQIERVEIIRGPGSVIYGGNAELAVVNVVTRGAGLKGAYLGGDMGVTPSAPGHRKLSFQLGNTFFGQDGLKVSVSGAVGTGLRSDRRFEDLRGQGFNMAYASEIDSKYVNVSAQWKGLRGRFLFHDLTVGMQDGLDTAAPSPSKEIFTSVLAELAYDLTPLEGLTVTPRVTYKRQLPWKVLERNDYFYDKSVDRVVAGLSASWDVLTNLNLQLGVEGMFDQARLNDLELTGFQTLFNQRTDENGETTGEASVAYQNLAVYAQVLFPNVIANLSAGLRYELHSQFGSSFVPRVGLTRVLGRFHFKALYSSAFRAPSIENINLGAGVTPERTTVIEGEVGVQLNDNLYAAVNAFDITVRDPIVYGVDPGTGEEHYRNFEQAGSRGLEAELRARYAAGWVRLSYSFYSPAGKNRIDTYQVPDHGEVVLGLAGHKVALQGSLTVFEDVAITPSVVVFSSRYAVTGVNEDESFAYSDLGPAVLVDLFVLKSNLFGQRGLEGGVGVHNLTNTPFVFPQPYASGHAPLPGLPFEVMLRVAYTHDLGGG